MRFDMPSAANLTKHFNQLLWLSVCEEALLHQTQLRQLFQTLLLNLQLQNWIAEEKQEARESREKEKIAGVMEVKPEKPCIFIPAAPVVLLSSMSWVLDFMTKLMSVVVIKQAVKPLEHAVSFFNQAKALLHHVLHEAWTAFMALLNFSRSALAATIQKVFSVASAIIDNLAAVAPVVTA